jgi:short subunit dehydrogenase-like uncharacterized protein
MMTTEVWVLGATGRTGGEIATELARQGVQVVVVGRHEGRLRAVAEPICARFVVAADVDQMAAAVRREHPAVVVNTVGPFHATATPIIDACLASGSDYLDLANDMAAVPAVLARSAEAAAVGRTLVTGAGFGVTATESVVVRLCEGRPPAQRVRVDMIPSLASTDGVLGEALAATITDGLPGVPGGGRFQGRRITNGRLVSAPVGGSPTRLTTPDGDEITTGLMPLGELIAAQNASGARIVEAATSEIPTGTVMRVLIPLGLPLLSIAPLRRLLTRRLAAVKTAARPRPREHSWAHARVEWADGAVRHGWLGLGDASDFTTGIAAEVAHRLARGEARSGAFTPAALFGAALAESQGGEYQIGEPQS